MKHLLIELEANGKSRKQWTAKLYVRMENTKHHVKEGEDILFTKYLKDLSKAEAEEVGQEIQDFKMGESIEPALGSESKTY